MSKGKSMKQRARERAEEREFSGGIKFLRLTEDTEMFKPIKGTNNFSILPYVVNVDNHPEVDQGQNWYQRTVWVHYNVGIEGETIICPLKTIKKKCPICEHRMKLIKDSLADEKEIGKLDPSERELFNVIHENEYKILLIAHGNFGKLLEEEMRDDDDYAGCAELEGGYNLRVRFKQKSWEGRKYLEASRIDFDEREDLDESVLDDVKDLDDIMLIHNYQTLYDLFWDMGDPPSGGDSDKKPGKKKKKKKIR